MKRKYLNFIPFFQNMPCDKCNNQAKGLTVALSSRGPPLYVKIRCLQTSESDSVDVRF